ncbi:MULTISPECIES: riboflavin synthase [Enterococcus]|uniref:Riboflavin synthase n=1 Tax=Enterococcus sulfureus ATCC 49903 TaxID=1140003 RepID=S0KSH9_9ENTE|nr:riboflavin synthase [Enterococcus sulfureus]EOT47607.1 riboflavin synthase, alpha subunit [Enterococcus sulfureus ATCC 49903]EOT83972.1 riboflavin synthase, alpha subunit [Enterococcus sulfureus ATCC 49903]
MFTGLIAEIGIIRRIKRYASSMEITCEASRQLLLDYNIGDSMAINGACLTAIHCTETTFTVLIMPETVKRTTFQASKIGDKVNLERAMQQNQRFEGHFVAGHIDTTTRLLDKKILDHATILTFSYPPKLNGQLIAQGSIAIQGVSLTITQTTTNKFSVSLIPHSSHLTTLGELVIGESVNLETDMIGKYVEVQQKRMQAKETVYE